MPRSIVDTSCVLAREWRQGIRPAVLTAILMPYSMTCLAVDPAACHQSGIEPDSARVISILEREIPRLMVEAVIPGLSIAWMRDGALVWHRSFGVANTETKEPVVAETLFEGASTGKPVFAYAVLKLVERGELDLDTPLVHYAPLSYLGDIWSGYDIEDERMLLVTTRMVLSHSAGFPNWPGERQEILFEPGERWNYSGSGYVTLGEVVKKITGLPLDEFVQREVFDPLGMTSSRFVWSSELEGRVAHRHTGVGGSRTPHQYLEPMAAGSLYTNARDYALFLLAIVNRTDLPAGIVTEMLTPQIQVAPEDGGNVYWGLGVALNETNLGPSLWHWGDNEDTKAYFELLIKQRSGLVYFANSRNGLSIAAALLDLALGLRGVGASREPLFTRTSNSAAIRLFRAYASGGKRGALDLIDSPPEGGQLTDALTAEDLVDLTREAMRSGDREGALAIAKRAADAFPTSEQVRAILSEIVALPERPTQLQ